MNTRDRQRYCGRPRSAGFTLAEVAIATMVIGLTLASALMGLRMGFGLIETARHNTLASQILQSEMENLRLKSWGGYDGVASLEDGPFEMDPSFQGTHADRFSTMRTINAPSSTVREITLEVEWNAFNGTTVSRRYITYFSKDGLNDYYYRTFR